MQFFRRTLRTLALLTFLGAGPLVPLVHAQEACEFLMEDGTTRNCTFTERNGKCYFEAMVSYDDCRASSHDWVMELVCEAAVQVDVFACTLGMIGDIIDLLAPF